MSTEISELNSFCSIAQCICWGKRDGKKLLALQITNITFKMKQENGNQAEGQFNTQEVE